MGGVLQRPAVGARARWIRGETPARALVVGRVLGNEIALLRVQCIPDAAPMIRLLASGVIPWESGASLGEPFERLLGWRAREQVVLVSPTPSLAGATVFLEIAPRERTEQRTEGVPDRAWLHHARWEAREHVLETAARFFDCTIESVRVLAEEIHEDVEPSSRLAATIIVGLADDPECLPPDVPPDIPRLQRALLPLLLGGLVGEQTDHVGLLLVEETQLSYGIWSGGRPLLLRSLPLGSTILVNALVEALRCSPREAATLLTRAENGDLSAGVMQVLARVLKPLLPLYSGAFQVFGEEIGQRFEAPARLEVLGNWATVFSRMFCRPAFVARCCRRGVLPRVLPSPSIADDRRENGGRLPDPQSVRLLEHLAVAGCRLLPEGVHEGRSPLRVHAYRAR